MVAQRFDIEVTDKVAASIRTKLRGIGEEARFAHTSVRDLNKELAGSSSRANRMVTEAGKEAARASRQQATEAKAATKAMQEEARAAQALAAQQERLAAVVERAANRQAAANAKARASAQQSSSGGNSNWQSTYSAQTDFMRNMGRGNSGSGTGAKALADEIDKVKPKLNEFDVGLKNVGKSGDIARHHLLNLGFQLQDIFVSLASGQKPLTVFIQQGAQIQGIASQAGVGLGGMARAAAGLLVPFLPLIAAVGVGVGAFALFNREINKEADLKKYANGLGLTSKEMRQLSKDLKESGGFTVTWGDTAKAVFQVTIRNILSTFGTDTTAIRKIWGDFLDYLWTATRATLSALYASVAGWFYSVKKMFEQGISLDNFLSGFKEAYDDGQQFFTDVTAQANKNAQARIKSAADEIKANRAAGKSAWDRAKELREVNAQLDAQISVLDKYGEALDRANQLEQIGQTFRKHGVPLTATEIEQLDKKIRLIQEGQRVQAEMTRINDEVNGAQQKYNDTLAAADKLYDQNALSAAEYARQIRLAENALEDATNPLAAMNRELEKQSRTIGLYGKSSDLQNYIEQIREMERVAGRSIFTGGSSTSEGGDIVVTASKRYRDDVQKLIDEFKAQQQQQDMATTFQSIDPRERQDPTSSSYILDNQKALYAEIDRLRQTDVINEEEAARRKRDVDRAYMDARLEYTGKIFGNLATLQDSHSKEVAAIGKAAAMAQATIDGIAAVQAALRGPPGPPWSYAIAAATGVAAAANVAKIAGVGFRNGGYTGSGSDGEMAGPAHRNEFIFDAQSTRRIGVPALEALKNGNNLTPAMGGAGGGGKTNVSVRQYPGVDIQVNERSDGDIEIIAERAVRRLAPQVVGDDIRRNPNSRTSKALQSSYKVTRNDR